MPETVPAKKPYLSKTLVVNLIVAAAAMFFPPAEEYIKANPQIVMSAFAVLNMVLRVVTKSKIEFY